MGGLIDDPRTSTDGPHRIRDPAVEAPAVIDLRGAVRPHLANSGVTDVQHWPTLASSADRFPPTLRVAMG